MNAEQFVEENYYGLKIDCPRDIQTIYQALEDYAKEQSDYLETRLKELQDWVIDENREPAKTKFTAGAMRNLAREIEFAIYKAEHK